MAKLNIDKQELLKFMKELERCIINDKYIEGKICAALKTLLGTKLEFGNIECLKSPTIQLHMTWLPCLRVSFLR